MESIPKNPNDVGNSDAMRDSNAMISGAKSGAINTGTQTNINTGGGAYIAGSVNIEGGDLVNRDKVYITQNFYDKNHGSGSAALSKEKIAQWRNKYLRWLQLQTQNIVLHGLKRDDGPPLEKLHIETAYVPLRAKFGGKGDINLNQVLRLGDRLAITGGPGSGKTTVLLHMAWALATSLLSGQSEPACTRLGLAPNKLPLPIFVPLASFARHLRNYSDTKNPRGRTLSYFIAHYLTGKEANFNLPNDFFAQLLEDNHDVLLLLDGLDEVANENERAKVRRSVDDLVTSHERLRVVVTCRTITYRDVSTPLRADFREITVRALNIKEHIAPMVRQAYSVIYRKDTELCDKRIQDLLQGIQRLEIERRLHLGKNTETLVNSPLMVRLMMIVHVSHGVLPNDRATLFDLVINSLLQGDYGSDEENIEEGSINWMLYRNMLQHAAFSMHNHGPDKGREIHERKLENALHEKNEFISHINNLLSHTRQRGDVLEERDNTYRFFHLALQEFLVARYLQEVIGKEGYEPILAYLNDKVVDHWWREPILLLIGYMRTQDKQSASEFLRALARIGTSPDAWLSASELAGTAALEWRDICAPLRAECARRIVALLEDTDALLASKPVLRARAGDVLARLGDTRFDPRRHYLPADDMLGFVSISADPEFRIGTREADKQKVRKAIGTAAYDDEINEATTPTSEFYLAKYPVTVAQFRAFAEATGSQSRYKNAVSIPRQSRGLYLVSRSKRLNGVAYAAPTLVAT